MGDTRCPVLTSWRTRWRWENVPRSESWPVRRTGVPSLSSEANASASAWAQSMPPSGSTVSRRRSSCLSSLGWTLKPSGSRSRSSLSAIRRSAETAVLTSGEGERHGRDAGGDVVGVDVDDRHVEALGEVGGPAGRARLLGVRGEADLVVLDDVQRPADGVAVEPLQVQRFRYDALAGEGG